VVAYRALGVEIAEQVAGPVDAYCGYIGTAGCFLGVTGALRTLSPEMLRVAIEPAESPVLSGGPPGTHRIEGGGVGFRPPLLVDDTFDEVQTVSTTEAFACARRAVREEGIFSGPSTGANLLVATRLAQRLGPEHRVVTVQVDSGMKYLGGDLYRS
jgi:cysteine synthase A